MPAYEMVHWTIPFPAVAGSVTIEAEAALSREDKADRVILLCQARPTGPVTVEA
jgi:hypothetical protein